MCTTAATTAFWCGGRRRAKTPPSSSANRIERIAAKSGGSGQNGNAINVFRAGSVMVSGNRIADCAFSAIRSNSGSNCQMIGNSCARLGEVALYAEFSFEGAVIANNLVDKAATGISVTNFNEGGRLAVVQGNLIRNLFFRKDADARGIGIAVEADSVVTGNVIEGSIAYGIIIGWGRYLRDVSVTDNLIRNAYIGIGVSADPSAGTALITNNLITGAKDGAHPRHERAYADRPRPDSGERRGLRQSRGLCQRRPLSLGPAARSGSERRDGLPQLRAGHHPSDADAAPIEHLAVELIGQRRPRLGQKHREQFGKRALGPALGAVVDLERDAEPKPRQRRAMHAFGAAFDEQLRRERAHGDGVEPPVPRHQHRRGEAGLDEPCSPPPHGPAPSPPRCRTAQSLAPTQQAAATRSAASSRRYPCHRAPARTPQVSEMIPAIMTCKGWSGRS